VDLEQKQVLKTLINVSAVKVGIVQTNEYHRDDGQYRCRTTVDIDEVDENFNDEKWLWLVKCGPDYYTGSLLGAFDSKEGALRFCAIHDFIIDEVVCIDGVFREDEIMKVNDGEVINNE